MKLHFVAQGKADIEYFQIALHKIVTEEKQLLKTKLWLHPDSKLPPAIYSLCCLPIYFSQSSSAFTWCVCTEFAWPVNKGCRRAWTYTYADIDLHKDVHCCNMSVNLLPAGQSKEFKFCFCKDILKKEKIDH